MAHWHVVLLSSGLNTILGKAPQNFVEPVFTWQKALCVDVSDAGPAHLCEENNTILFIYFNPQNDRHLLCLWRLITARYMIFALPAASLKYFSSYRDDM